MSALHLLVRVWTHLYTFALPSEIRDRRRAEIESDAWESEHDPDIPHYVLLIRLLRGMPADLLWRLEVTPSRHHAHAALGALAGAGVLALALWAFVRQPVPLPTPPRRPVRITLGLMPPPPPPR
jgi:hypothetical protein